MMCFPLTEEERKTYSNVMRKLDDFFSVRKNIVYECAKFNRRDQKEGEGAEIYITELYRLVETCKYQGMKDKLL